MWVWVSTAVQSGYHRGAGGVDTRVVWVWEGRCERTGVIDIECGRRGDYFGCVRMSKIGYRG